MNPAQQALVLQALWPQGDPSHLGVWAILDCARDPKIYLALLESKLEFRCLYSGHLPRDLEMVAPQLVELSPASRLTKRWLDEGWGQSWGVFLKIQDASNLRHHLRKFLKVRVEHEGSLVFRYYDPRVLRVYLPTCTADELQRFLGPIASYLAEDVDGDKLIEFTRAGAKNLQERINFAALDPTA